MIIISVSPRELEEKPEYSKNTNQLPNEYARFLPSINKAFFKLFCYYFPLSLVRMTCTNIIITVRNLHSLFSV